MSNTSISILTPHYQILACSATASFHLAVGACLSFSAILIPKLESPESDIQVNKDDISWIGKFFTAHNHTFKISTLLTLSTLLLPMHLLVITCQPIQGNMLEARSFMNLFYFPPVTVQYFTRYFMI